MAQTYDSVKNLYEQASKEISSNPQKWKAFLKTACYNYKLRYDEQLLIYAQKPNATAVLPIQKWNSLFGRWVNRGANGIAVFEKLQSDRQRLIYYFDISDTHESDHSHAVPIWNMEKEYSDDVIEALENSFGITNKGKSIEQAIIIATQNAVEDNLQDYSVDLLDFKDGSLLEEMNDDAVISLYKKIVSNSVAYMIMSRLALDTDSYFESSDFSDVTNFNTKQSLNSLGFAVSDIAEMELSEIAKTISYIKNKNRTFANIQKEEYTKAEDETERSFYNEDERDNIHNAGRLQPSELNNTGTAGGDFGQIRSNEAEISRRKSQSNVLQLSDELYAGGTSDGSGTSSNRNGRSPYQEDGGTARIDGRTQSDRYDGLGAQDEQHQERSSGNRNERSDFRLKGAVLPPTFEEQISFFNQKAEESKSSAFSIPQEVIDDALTLGSSFSQGKMRIYEQFQKSLSLKENAEFLKKEYGTGGRFPAGSFEGYNQNHDSKGLEIQKGFGKDAPRILLNWQKVAKRISFLILSDRYLNEKEKAQYPVWLEKEELKRLEAAEIRKNKEILSSPPQEKQANTLDVDFLIGKEVTLDGNLFVVENVGKISGDVSLRDVDFQSKNGIPINRVEKLETIQRALKENEVEAEEKSPESPGDDAVYHFKIGDTVYIGANEYEILSLDENRVMLYDFNMPLFNKELSFSEFEKQVTENALNDHLIIKADKSNEKQPLSNESYDDVFFLSDDSDSITWMYYNPDSASGGQFVTNTFRYSDVIEAAEKHKDVNDFFDYLGSIANQTLADIGTEWFEVAKRDISQTPTYTGITENTMSLLIEAANKELSIPVYDRETEILYDVFDCLNIEDISIAFDENGLVAKSNEQVWHGSEFYKYLIDEKISFEKDGSVDGIEETLLNDFKELCRHNSVEISVSSKTNAVIVPAWEKTKKSKSFDLHPDVPMNERLMFDLKSNPVEVVGKKERFRRNMDAIKVLKECEFENRFATPEEQVVLSKYVGWGGLPEAFDENNNSWANEFVELYTTLSPFEYSSARESTLTAFYTPPEVISAIYNAMEQLGFKRGNLLEPSCGIGHFIGMLPDSMKDSKIYGVELDSISAAIAQQLYQKCSIAAQGFEETNLPDSFFDGVIGNVPFGDFKVLDKRYDKNNFLIHDYFFAKSLDKLRPGGIMALITSKGTMDKEKSSVRKYIAQRAELLGAIRLPNNTFRGNAGTEVVSDILILQKRDRLVDIEPDWVHLDTDENGIKMNSYFVHHPEMVLGKMEMVSGRFGMESTCTPYENPTLDNLLQEAISNIKGEITEYQVEENVEEDNFIPADPLVRNFSYTFFDDKLYFRENSRMIPVDVSATALNRIKGMILIRDAVRNLIELQTENYPDEDIKQAQKLLNDRYDNFTEKYGIINSRANKSVFHDDSSFCLLSALEIVNENGELERKADMFFKRTIKPHSPVKSVDTASEALAVSMGEKATVDMEYMAELTGKSEEELFADLKGVVFLNPLFEYGNSNESKYLMADEYLSGNVREKLSIAKKSAQLYPDDYQINVEALEKVQPKDLKASEISVRLGATWLPVDVVQQFMYELLGTPIYARWNVKVHFSPYTNEWNVEGKAYDRSNIKAYQTYGTSRMNAYKIIEETLNLKDVRIFDYEEDAIGKKVAILNKKETAIAQSKQELIKQNFADWIWKDPQRREKLTKMYNEKFNSTRPREYDGSHITFSGMNPDIELREHQKNAVAHILYGGNTLLAHAVGAGKTFEMTAAAMEAKRLGLCSKSLFVVPNHLTEQWASEFLQLYPAANILVATKKDFETKNRKKFCGRIATGDYDAVILGHSQFEKIPMSIERQRAILEQQLDEITQGIADLKRNRGENFSVKQLEKSRKTIKQKLDKLNDQSRKDDVVTFEELGIDRLFIDESHYYKNLFLYTKMRNVGGIAQTEAQKSSDLFMKCRYLDEITGGRGVVFATGTPISNSMVELYTIQRYLQYNTLVKNNLQHFDAWASTFGETVTAVELTPEGYTLVGR